MLTLNEYADYLSEKYTYEEISAGNVAICEFMGYPITEHGDYLIPSSSLQFTESDHAEWCETVDVEYDSEDPKSVENFVKLGGYYFYIHKNHLMYHCSYNWIMPIFEEIENRGFYTDVTRKCNGLETTVIISDAHGSAWRKDSAYFHFTSKYKLLAIWEAVVACVNWMKKYNL